MDDPGGMSRRERPGDLHGDVERWGQFHPAVRQLLAERLTVNELGGDEMCLADFPDVVNREDVRMIERGGGARFPLEAMHAVLISGEASGEQFERDLATEPGILLQINL